MRGVRWEADVTSRDPTLKRGRDALLRDPAWHVQKDVQGVQCVEQEMWIHACLESTLLSRGCRSGLLITVTYLLDDRQDSQAVRI
jgi:hypothetical protein